MLVVNNNGQDNNKGYEPIDVSDNFLLKCENLDKVLPPDEFSSTNCNNILDDLYKIGFKLSLDFSDSLDQLLKSSSVKSKDSDASKNLLSRLCDVYSVFKISLRECNSLENIRNAFDNMKKSAPLKNAIDSKQISFSESKILTMKLLAALRAKENGINIDSIVEDKKVKKGLTRKSFMTILQYLNGNKEDQNYFFEADFNLVVEYVMDHSDYLFPATTSESHSSDFNNVVSFLKHFEAVVPKEDVDKKINELTNKLNGRIKNQDAGKNITAQISGVGTANVQLSDIQKDTTEGPAYVETKSAQEPVNNDNDKTAVNTKIDSTIDNQVNSTTDINIKNKTEITETNVTEMNSTNLQSTGVQNTAENPAHIKADNLMNDQNKKITTTQPATEITGMESTSSQSTGVQNTTEDPAYIKTDNLTNNQNKNKNKDVIATTQSETEITETNVTEMDSTSSQFTVVQNTTENPAHIKADNLMNDQNKKITTTQSETGITGMGSTSSQSTDVQDTAKTNEKTGMSYAIPVILTIISPILWLISACSGFLLLWMIASGIATAVALVSWIIVILVNLSADSPKDKSLHVLNEKSDGQSPDFVKNVSHKVVGGPAQSGLDDKNKGKDAGPVQ